MSREFLEEKQRQRAPSQRALETRARIFDAAERVFSRAGFDAASIRDIAEEAEVQGALVNHHGGSKEALFWRVVARRAEILSTARLDALAARKAEGALSLTAVLTCYFEPYLSRAECGDVQWLAYARLVAIVSSDTRWQELAATCFDPTATRFVEEIAALYPPKAQGAVAAAFIYSVAALLALLTAQWRMVAMGDGRTDASSHLDELVAFCAAGIEASVARAS
ncbi:TetR family transcriptional regulator [Shimia sp. R10_1]|uniref:TetR/AcrR family transcriptional regulator n=1 Tax=Shimia sp. R10_1 TaxID=2821095 RepID=UPI001ADBBF18|nr:TetR/AcrR family transcriptional regulator [Shimia sp. R10_1]MBO9472517.1 TetR family transcriptional regulator [Shimia sp. R10_1]